MTTADYLTQLQQDREDLVDNLEAKGITGLSGDETFTELVPEVLNISGGSSEWSNIGWSNMPPSFQTDYNITKTLYDNWNPSSPTAQYFNNQGSMIIAPGIDTQNLTTFEKFFYNCSSLTDVPSFDTTSSLTYKNMFQGCSALKSVDISNYSTANFVVGQTGSFKEMFSGCYNLEDVNFGGFQTFDPSKTNNIYLMFNNCTKLSNNTLNDILELCVLIAPNIDASSRKLSGFGINSTFDNWNNIPNLSNYQDFLNAGWSLS